MTTEEINKLLKPLLPKDKRAFVGIEKKCVFYGNDTSLGIPVTIKGVHFDTGGVMVKCKGLLSIDLIVPIETLYQNHMAVYKEHKRRINDMLGYIWIDQMNGAISRHNDFEIDILRKNIALANKLKKLHEKKMKQKESKQ